MRLRTFVLALLLTATTAARLVAQGAAGESAAQKDARMAWWRDARFGMFIHWGLYAVPAGTWKGERVTGLGEWIMERAQDPALRTTRRSRDSSTPRSSTRTSGCASPRTRG